MDPDRRCIPHWTWGFSIAMLVYRRVYPNSMKSHDQFWGFGRFRLGFELGSSHSLIHQKDGIPQWRSHSKKKRKLWVTSERFRPRILEILERKTVIIQMKKISLCRMPSPFPNFLFPANSGPSCAIDQHLTQKRLQRSAKARSEKHFASWSWGTQIPCNSHLTLCQLCNSPLPRKRNTAKGNFQGSKCDANLQRSAPQSAPKAQFH